MRLGLKIAEGREAEVYAWDGGAVLKLYRPGFLGYAAEASALATLEGRGVAPRLIGMVEVEQRRGLILERVDGSDMLTLLERTPWRLAGLARILGQGHVVVNSMQAPADLSDLREALATRVEAGVRSRQSRDFVLLVLDRLPVGDRLCHGDLHPGNVLVAAGRAQVIDWANAARGVPEADHARTMLLLSRADPLPGTSALFRGLMSAGRSTPAPMPRPTADARPYRCATFVRGRSFTPPRDYRKGSRWSSRSSLPSSMPHTGGRPADRDPARVGGVGWHASACAVVRPLPVRSASKPPSATGVGSLSTGWQAEYRAGQTQASLWLQVTSRRTARTLPRIAKPRP